MKDKGLIELSQSIPALIVVTIGTTLFIISCINAYLLYTDANKNKELQNDAERLFQGIRNYDKLKVEPMYSERQQACFFDIYKIELMSYQQIKNDFSSKYKYRVIIEDRIDSRIWEFGELSKGKNKIVLNTPIAIKITTNEIHVGILTLEVFY
ncbi:MAG: hypothetical protein AB1779_08560 [Candidatus Thermoplasmatota archaeon]